MLPTSNGKCDIVLQKREVLWCIFSTVTHLRIFLIFFRKRRGLSAPQKWFKYYRTKREIFFSMLIMYVVLVTATPSPIRLLGVPLAHKMKSKYCKILLDHHTKVLRNMRDFLILVQLTRQSLVSRDTNHSPCSVHNQNPKVYNFSTLMLPNINKLIRFFYKNILF